MKKVYVVTGGPGSGKTSIIDALKQIGFYIGEEVARDIIKDCDVIIDRSFFRMEICSRILKKRIEQYDKAPENQICFFDRGIPDIIGYLKYDAFEVPFDYYNASKNCKYADVVFIAPPWKEIYSNDAERMETFEDSVRVYESIVKAYRELGYKVIILPKKSVKERAEFILNFVENVL